MLPFAFAAALMAAAPAPSAAEPAPPPRRTITLPRRVYAEGQIWHYRTRPGEEGSVVAIRRVGTVPEAPGLGPVYHVSLIGVKLGDRFGTMLPHLPVSRATLDSSLTVRAKGGFELPPFEEGIEEWRSAKGGVFTVGLAEIVDFTQQALARAGLPE